MQKRKVEEINFYVALKDLERRRSKGEILKKKVKTLAKKYFEEKSNLVERVILTNSDQDNFLNYTIILKKYSLKNKIRVFGFLGDYFCTDLSYKYPVDFNIISKNEEVKTDYQEVVFQN